MSANLINSSILLKQFSAAVNKHFTMESNYTDNAESCIIQAVLNTTPNIMKRPFNFGKVREMSEMILSNDEYSTIDGGVSQGAPLLCYVMSNKEK